MADGLLPGDDGFDPERTDKELKRRRNPKKPPSDEQIKRTIRMGPLIQEQTELEVRIQLP